MMLTDWGNMTADEKLKIVTDCIAKNMSAGMIAESIGGASRNAIIGYAHRRNLRLPGKSTGVPRRPKESVAETKCEKQTDKKDDRPIVIPPPFRVSTYGPVSMLMLTERTCKWPLNASYIHVPTDKMMFCGEPKDIDQPYCSICRLKSIDRVKHEDRKSRWHR